MKKLLATLGLWLGLSSLALAQAIPTGNLLIQTRPQGSGGLSVLDVANYTISLAGGTPGGAFLPTTGGVLTGPVTLPKILGVSGQSGGNTTTYQQTNAADFDATQFIAAVNQGALTAGQEYGAMGFGNSTSCNQNAFACNMFIEFSSGLGSDTTNLTNLNFVNTKGVGMQFDQGKFLADTSTRIQACPGWKTGSCTTVQSITVDGSTSGNGYVGVNTSGVGISPNIHPQYLLDVNVLDGTSQKIRIANTTTSTAVGGGSITAMESVGIRTDGNGSFNGRFGAATVRTDGTAIASGATIGLIAFGGQYGTNTAFTQANLLYPASVKGIAEGNFSAAGAMATGLAFFTGVAGDDLTTANKTYGTERMRIDNTGKVGIGISSSIPNLLSISTAAADNTQGIKYLNTGNGATYIGFAAGAVLGTDQSVVLLKTGITSNDPSSGTTRLTANAAGIIVPNIASDATHTDTTVCQDSTTHQFYSGSGTLGVCLGTSSARFKHDIRPLNAGLDQIMKLEAVSYKLNKDHGDPDKLLYGFTAEQGEKVLPALTAPDVEGKPNTFDYLGVVPVLVKGMQQLKAENDNLRACNDNWKCRIFGIK
jgi:hypothetical protein